MFEPLGNRVLVQPDTGERVLESGVTLPATTHRYMVEGKVIAAGPGKPGAPMPIKAGDVVFFGPNIGTPLMVGGANCLLLDLEAIFGMKRG